MIHGSLSIQVTTDLAVVEAPVPSLADSGPGRKGRGDRNGPGVEPVLVPETTVDTNEGPAQTMKLDEGANVDELVTGLHAIGATAHDVVAILEAIKAEGGMQAELEVQ